MIVKADLHIHSVLSPCADLEMSPVNIVTRAYQMGLGLIAVTDHNCTLHGPLTRSLAAKRGIYCLYGAEVNTREEIHCLCLVDTEEQRLALQEFIEHNITRIPNKPDVFGYQVQVNEQDEIVQEIDYLLHAALTKSIDEVAGFVHGIGGVFIPAHVDRPKYSVTSQLGFVPPSLEYDALEISKNSLVEQVRESNPIKPNTQFIRNSDSHFIHQVGSTYTTFKLEKLSFECFKQALLSPGNSSVLPLV
ncbi:MAG: PHP domain-containing protein [Bacteroidota bacterium]